MNKIYKEIEAELDRAKELHPDFPESIVRMVSIMAEEAGEAIREANRIEDDGTGDPAALRTELIQTAAMCVRCLENLKEKTDHSGLLELMRLECLACKSPIVELEIKNGMQILYCWNCGAKVDISAVLEKIMAELKEVVE